jgi:hypothetical protein
MPEAFAAATLKKLDPPGDGGAKVNWIRSRNRWAKPVIDTLAWSDGISWVTPPSTLNERSGSRSGFPVANPVAKLSKNDGSLNPVPTEARTRVRPVAKASTLAR